MRTRWRWGGGKEDADTQGRKNLGEPTSPGLGPRPPAFPKLKSVLFKRLVWGFAVVAELAGYLTARHMSPPGWAAWVCNSISAQQL